MCVSMCIASSSNAYSSIEGIVAIGKDDMTFNAEKWLHRTYKLRVDLHIEMIGGDLVFTFIKPGETLHDVIQTALIVNHETPMESTVPEKQIKTGYTTNSAVPGHVSNSAPIFHTEHAAINGRDHHVPRSRVLNNLLENFPSVVNTTMVHGGKTVAHVMKYMTTIGNHMPHLHLVVLTGPQDKKWNKINRDMVPPTIRTVFITSGSDNLKEFHADPKAYVSKHELKATATMASASTTATTESATTTATTASATTTASALTTASASATASSSASQSQSHFARSKAAVYKDRLDVAKRHESAHLLILDARGTSSPIPDQWAIDAERFLKIREEAEKKYNIALQATSLGPAS
jgi:hypothetical protein